MTAWPTQADLGGQPCTERVLPEPEGELFHAPWEPQALALTVAMGATGAWNLDMTRAARETLPDYRALDYYRIWLGALERMLAERGLASAEELAAGQPLEPARPLPRLLRAADVDAVLARGAPTARTGGPAPRFAVGQRVRTRAEAVPHHTRLPAYARGKVGTVEALHGAHILPDSHARGLGESPEPLYTVVFEGAELWGADAVPGLRVSVDAWQSYLEAA